MSLDDWLGIVLPAVLVAGYLFFRHYVAKNRCPYCGSRHHWRTDREVEEVTIVDTMMGDPGGGAKQIMSTIKESYRCRQCGRTWTETFKEI